MKLTKTTDYALRVLIHLASASQTSLTMGAMASALNIPYDNLSKLIQSMARNNLVITRPGKRGGVQLAKDPDNISLRDVVETIEGPIQLSDCLFDFSAGCALNCGCQLKFVLNDLQEQVGMLFGNVSIKKMIKKDGVTR